MGRPKVRTIYVQNFPLYVLLRISISWKAVFSCCLPPQILRWRRSGAVISGCSGAGGATGSGLSASGSRSMFEDDAQSTYRWEQGVSKSWDTVQEDEAGNLITISTDRERSHRAKQNRVTKSIRRGLIRYMVLAIDSSKSAAENDYKPCRLEVSNACTKNFIAEYFDQNPISQIGLILTRDRSAQRLSEMSGNPKNHIHQVPINPFYMCYYVHLTPISIHQLQSVRNMDGLPSLQNTLLLAMSMLRHIPNYGHRELLIVFSSLSTCDPGDIFKTIREAKALKVALYYTLEHCYTVIL
jgi:transcription initiation factor TFIIH subunit 2